MRQTIENIQKISNIYSEILGVSRQLLRNAPEAQEHREYINARISKYNQDKFDFGYFPPEENLSLLISKIGEEPLLKSKMVYKWFTQERGQILTTYKSPFAKHNIIFPIRDEWGNIVALIGRCILPKEEMDNLNIQKYRYTYFEKQLHLFGLHQAKKSIRKAGYAILVEGQIDCITCHAYGFHNVVALGGTSLSKYQLFSLLKITDRLYLLLDKDNAGQRACNKIQQRYSKYATIKEITLPDTYKDIDEYLRMNGNCDILSTLS